jgi:imidazolonepropionase-like amidohydrolase
MLYRAHVIEKCVWTVIACTALACSRGDGGSSGNKDTPVTPDHVAVAGDVAIVNGTVIPMDREASLVAHTVLIRGDRIVAVAASAKIDTKAATVVDATGKWVLPGLADMHVHTWNPSDFDLYLLNGVTTVRDLFGSSGQLTWREEIATGKREGPTLIAAGPIIDGDPPIWPGSAVVTTVDAARAEVARQKAAGYDWIKVYNGLSEEAHAAIVDEAKKLGIPVGGHVPKAVGIHKTIASGQRTIEHLDGYVPWFGEEPTEPTIEPTVRAGVWNCPTLVVTDRFGRMDKPEDLQGTRGLEHIQPLVRQMWDPKNDFRLQKMKAEDFERTRAKNKRRRELVRDLAKAGAKLVLGTDTGNPYVVPGFAVVDELGLLVESGLTPWQALRTATAASAELLGTPTAFGVLVAGARADVIVVDKDPLVAVTHVADPSTVVVRGKLRRRDELLAAVERAAAPSDRFADMPAIEVEGEKVLEARYDIQLFEQSIGSERAILSRLADKTEVVRGQAVYVAPVPVTMKYRATRDDASLEATSVTPPTLAIARKGKDIVVQHGTESRVLAAPDGIIAIQTIADYFWMAAALRDLKVGATKTIVSAEIRTEGKLTIEPGTYAIVRKPDAAGDRVYSIDGKNGEMKLTGELTVAPDGAPSVSLVLPFGTFALKRQK